MAPVFTLPSSRAGRRGFMIITKQNLKGGKKITRFPIIEEQGTLGYKIGYCSNCNETIIMPLQQRDEIVATFHYEDKTLEDLRKILDPRVPFRKIIADWLIRLLGGNVASAVDNY